MKLAKKITVKGVCGDVKKNVLMLAKDGVIPNGEKIPLMRVIGKANRFEIKKTDIGESVCLKGQFMATNLETGEETRAGSCYLPETAVEAVAGMLQGEVDSVEFGFDISVVTDDSSVVGYVYDVLPLIEPQEDDAMTRLASSLPQAALPSPEKGEKKAASK